MRRDYGKYLAGIVILAICAWSTAQIVEGQPIVPIHVSRIIFGAASSGVVIRSSTGTPEAAVTAPIGSVFLRSDGGAGTALYVKESGSGNTGWVTLPGATVTASSSNTFTNKTLDAEGTGNVLTVPFHQFYLAATCENDVPYLPGWSNAASETPTPTCFAGTQIFGQADYPDSGTKALRNSFWLPSDWTGTIDVNLGWKTAATSGNVVWQIETACVASGESADPSWNAASTVTDAAIGTANRFNQATITGLTVTGCAAGELMNFAVFRDPTTGADTLGATASLLYVDLVYRRAM